MWKKEKLLPTPEVDASSANISSTGPLEKLKEAIQKTPKMIKRWLISAALVAQLFTACAPKGDIQKEHSFEVKKGETFSWIVTNFVRNSIDDTYDPKTNYEFHQKLLKAIEEDNKKNGKIADSSKIYPWDVIVIDGGVVAEMFENLLVEEKETKENTGIASGAASWPTLQQSRERFTSWKEYFLESAEVEWKKKLLDVYRNVPLPKIQTVESGKTWWNVITKVGKVVLHSTAADYDEAKTDQIAKRIYAHFLVTEWGKIFKVNRNWKLRSMTHAWEALWGDLDSKYFQNHSIGIEVEAAARKERSDPQYKAVQSLLKWIAENYNPDLTVSDVLTHSQIGYDSKYKTRGRKSDPYFVNRPKLWLPNNYLLYDASVAKGQVNSNIVKIDESYPKTHLRNMTIWLRESHKLAKSKK